jgi:hypothetical protein
VEKIEDTEMMFDPITYNKGNTKIPISLWAPVCLYKT